MLDADELVRKQHLLVSACRTLKKEFIGIDQAIDDIIHATSSWFLFPDLQERPIVVNLWGLTGVGKSSVIKRLSELLQTDKSYYTFDMGKKDPDWEPTSTIRTIYEHHNGYPIMMVFDEFQHMRSLEKKGSEHRSTLSNAIWQLLDTGKFSIMGSTHILDKLYDTKEHLSYLLQAGVVVEKGKVVKNHDLYHESFENALRDQGYHVGTEQRRQENFIPINLIFKMYEISRLRYDSVHELKRHTETLDGSQSIAFLDEFIQIAKAPVWLDCSKSIMYVIGNLDEAYTMGGNFSPDIDADTFYAQTQKITLPEIKSALKMRFRNEHISRLGNRHIIYPSISKKAFKTIIENELLKVAKMVSDQTGIRLFIDHSIYSLIYDEGVYPTQGIRPVLSTIHHVIQSNLGAILAKAVQAAADIEAVRLYAEKQLLLASAMTMTKEVCLIKIPLQLTLTTLRKETNDETLIITSVHESGHAVLSSLLLKKVPTEVLSNMVDGQQHGLTYIDNNDNFINREKLKHLLATIYGGYAAELLVFGKDKVTNGSSHDIQMATELAVQMVKEKGFASFPAKYYVSDIFPESIHDPYNELDIAVVELLKESLRLAMATLEIQEKLLLKISDKLRETGRLNKAEIISIIENHAVGVDWKIHSVDETSEYETTFLNKMGDESE